MTRRSQNILPPPVPKHIAVLTLLAECYRAEKLKCISDGKKYVLPDIQRAYSGIMSDVHRAHAKTARSGAHCMMDAYMNTISRSQLWLHGVDCGDIDDDLADDLVLSGGAYVGIDGRVLACNFIGMSSAADYRLGSAPIRKVPVMQKSNGVLVGSGVTPPPAMRPIASRRERASPAVVTSSTPDVQRSTCGELAT